MFQTDFCEVYLDKKLEAVICIWKKSCRREDYREPLEYGLSILQKHRSSNWIIDTSNGFENEEEDNKWLIEDFIPRAIASTCKHIYYIIDRNSLLWDEITQQGLTLEKCFSVSLCESFKEVCDRIKSSSSTIRSAITSRCIDFQYRELKSDALSEASNLVWNVFSEFVAPEYSQEGIETFRSFIQPMELKKALESGSFFMLGCFDGEKLVGVVAMRDFCHVSLLFVDKAYHGRGIAKGLFAKAMKRCIQENTELGEITVNSSPYAVEIYKRLGFEVTGEQATTNGITYIPLALIPQPLRPISWEKGFGDEGYNPYRKFAQYYDAYVGDFREDIPVYLNFVTEGARVLEVGCGTGRILKPLLDAGCNVTGVDISPDMLYTAKEKLADYINAGNLRILEHNLCGDAIVGKFDRAFVTFYTFNYLIGDSERERFIENIYDILEPGGIIVIDLFYPMIFSKPELENKWTKKTFTIHGRQIELRDKRTMNGDIEERVQRYVDGSAVDEIITHRKFFSKTYVKETLLKAGFKDVRFAKGYKFDRMHELKVEEIEIGSFIVTAEK